MIAPGKNRLARPAPAAILWWLLLASIALVCAGLQLDREARSDASLAPFVPTPFRSFAQEKLSLAAIAAQRGPEALEEATRLVARRPVPGEHLGQLAIASELGGDAQVANAALLMSAGRGWRFAATQYYVAGLALQSGEPGIAAERALALWIAGGPDEHTADMMGRMIAEPASRARIADWLANRPDQVVAFTGWARNALPPAQVGEVLAAAGRQGAELPCQLQEQLMQRYLRAAQPVAARQVWLGTCGRTSGDPANTSFFERRADHSIGALGWRPQGGARFDGDGRLVFVTRGSSDEQIAERFLALPPGSYRFSASASESMGLRLDVNCIGADSKVRRAARLLDGERFIVPARNCRVQWLRLYAAAGEGSLAHISIE